MLNIIPDEHQLLVFFEFIISRAERPVVAKEVEYIFVVVGLLFEHFFDLFPLNSVGMVLAAFLSCSVLKQVEN